MTVERNISSESRAVLPIPEPLEDAQRTSSLLNPIDQCPNCSQTMRPINPTWVRTRLYWCPSCHLFSEDRRDQLLR